MLYLTAERAGWDHKEADGLTFYQITNLSSLVSKCPRASEAAVPFNFNSGGGRGEEEHTNTHLSGPCYVPRTHKFHWLSQTYDNIDNNSIQTNIENDNKNNEGQ